MPKLTEASWCQWGTRQPITGPGTDVHCIMQLNRSLVKKPLTKKGKRQKQNEQFRRGNARDILLSSERQLAFLCEARGSTALLCIYDTVFSGFWFWLSHFSGFGGQKSWSTRGNDTTEVNSSSSRVVKSGSSGFSLCVYSYWVYWLQSRCPLYDGGISTDGPMSKHCIPCVNATLS